MSSPETAACPNGNHDFSAWSYQTNNSCIQQRRCKRNGCDAVESQTKHRQSEFVYLSDDACEQVRDCLRCKQAEENRVTHTFGQWDEFGCIKMRTCSRCAFVEQAAIPSGVHDFTEWKTPLPLPLLSELMKGQTADRELLEWCIDFNAQLVGTNARANALCVKERSCKRSGCATIESRAEHKLTGNARIPDPKFMECWRVEACANCKALVEAKLVHTFSPWTYTADRVCTQKRQCKITACGAEESRSEQHTFEFKYAAANSCVQEKLCSRCGFKAKETQTPHLWSKWESAKPNTCVPLKRACSRCKTEEKQVPSIPHEWEDVSNDCRSRVNKCKVCEQTNSISMENHNWVMRMRGNIERPHCTKCGAISLD